jgi:hypothetical protein
LAGDRGKTASASPDGAQSALGPNGDLPIKLSSIIAIETCAPVTIVPPTPQLG